MLLFFYNYRTFFCEEEKFMIPYQLMPNQLRIVVAFLVFILTVHFAVVPFLHKRQASRTVETILSLWQAGDLAPTFKYWKDEELSPPVYGVSSYKILDKKFSPEKKAEFLVAVEFSEGNFLKSGRWLFSLKHTNDGWKILSFARIGN